MGPSCHVYTILIIFWIVHTALLACLGPGSWIHLPIHAWVVHHWIYTPTDTGRCAKSYLHLLYFSWMHDLYTCVWDPYMWCIQFLNDVYVILEQQHIWIYKDLEYTKDIYDNKDLTINLRIQGWRTTMAASMLGWRTTMAASQDESMLPLAQRWPTGKGLELWWTHASSSRPQNNNKLRNGCTAANTPWLWCGFIFTNILIVPLMLHDSSLREHILRLYSNDWHTCRGPSSSIRGDVRTPVL